MLSFCLSFFLDAAAALLVLVYAGLRIACSLVVIPVGVPLRCPRAGAGFAYELHVGPSVSFPPKIVLVSLDKQRLAPQGFFHLFILCFLCCCCCRRPVLVSYDEQRLAQGLFQCFVPWTSSFASSHDDFFFFPQCLRSPLRVAVS